MTQASECVRCGAVTPVRRLGMIALARTVDSDFPGDNLAQVFEHSYAFIISRIFVEAPHRLHITPAFGMAEAGKEPSIFHKPISAPMLSRMASVMTKLP